MSVKRAIVVATVLVVALVASDALAVFAGREVFLPSVGRKPGAGGSQWYTTVWVYNPNAAPVNLTFYLLERDKDNSAAPFFNDTLPAGDVRRYDNAIWTMFSVEVFGALRVLATDRVVVNSRIYSQAAGLAQKDSVGQFFGGIPATFAIGSGQKTQVLGVFETSPSDASEFRYNFGFVETAGANATVGVTVYDQTGASIGSKSYTVRPYEQKQYRFPTEFPALSTTNARLEVEVTSGSGKIAVFGSGVANTSTDPSTFEMTFRDDLLGASGGLLAVTHDATLSGDGTSASPLGVATNAITTGRIKDGEVGSVDLAPAAVTKAKLSAAGGAAGQVLGTDGSNLVWQAGGGFTVPYEGSATTNSFVLKISNLGAGWAGFFDATNNYPTLVGGNNGTGIGVYGNGHANAIGVRGISSNNNGIEGQSTSGNGVWAKSSSGNGMYAESLSGNGILAKSTGAGNGVNAQAASGNGVLATSTSGNGVLGRANAANAYGVYGDSVGSGYGVHGKQGAASGLSDSNRRGGVWGDSTDGQGVLGTSKNTVGVAGMSQSRHGVQGIALGGATSAAVYAYAQGTAGYAGYFGGSPASAGKVTVTGTLTKPAGSFLIDHPLDPGGKYLSHSFVESPDMMNIYNGTVVLDARGEASVELPEWFEALNREFRYQLTCIGGFAPVYIGEKIRGNRFKIAGGTAGLEVSWQVTGVRHDAFAEAHRIPVEQDKPSAERGTFLYPELFGESEARSVEWVRNPQLMLELAKLSEKTPEDQ